MPENKSTKKTLTAKKNIDFIWNGLNSSRKEVKGEIVATSIAEAKKKLRAKQIRVLRLKKKPQPLFSKGKPVDPSDVAFASRQMSTMIGAGMPIAKSDRCRS